MKVYIDDIKNIDWLNALLTPSVEGAKFLTTKSPAYFVVYYDYVEEKSEIKIKSTSKTFNINDLIYRQQYYSQAEYTGYLQEPFDTNNLLFYLVLRNLNPNITDEDKQKIDELFLKYKAEDLLKSKNKVDAIKIQSSYEINGKASYYDAISKILFIQPTAVNGLQLITDLIDNSISNKHGYSFYNGVLKKIVISVSNPDGGLIPEEDGLMRYMFVGEKYYKNDTLEKAKYLLRSGMSLEDIYIQTGWYWNKYDKKWRYKLPTSSFSYKSGALKIVEYNGNSYNVHIPDKFKDKIPTIMQKLIDLSDDKKHESALLDLVSIGYSSTVSDIFSYDDLYSIYKDVKDTLCFYIQATNPLKSDLKDYSFHYADTGVKHLCLVSDRFNEQKVLTIAAHEIQHTIQKLEGFGNGGNQYFAKLILSIGSGQFRRYFFLLTSFLEEIIKKASLIPLDKWKKLADDIQNSGDTGIIKIIIDGKEIKRNYGTSNLTILSDLIRYKSDDPNMLNLYAQQIAYSFLEVASVYPNAAQSIEQFLTNEINYQCTELFEMCQSEIKKLTQKHSDLTFKGWSSDDIKMLNFRAYQYLVGEFESRYIQATTKINPDLLTYFTPYTSETINPEEVNVYGNDNRGYTESSSKFGIELTPDNRYILHTKKNKDAPIMILHEYGHIIFDLLKEENITEIEYSYDKSSGINVEEYFCESFVDYVVRKNINKEFNETIEDIYVVKDYNRYDLLFDDFLFGAEEIKIDEKKLSDMLSFINKILE
jgi:hypothetical protein